MKFFLLTDISKTIGLGHYYRILTIYNELKSNPKNEIYFFIQSDADVVSNLVGKLYNWRSYLLKDFLISNDDVVVIDSYLVDEFFFSNILRFTKNIWYMDDFVQLELNGIRIINPSIEDNINGYKFKDLVYSGPSFVTIKPEIRAIRNTGITRDGSFKILVYLGGAQSEFDLYELFSGIVEYSSDVEIIFISITKIDRLDKLSSRLIVKNVLQAELFSDLLKSIDFAIVATGQIIFDLMFLSIPFVGLKTSESQSKNVQGLKKLFPSAVLIESKELNSNTLSSSLSVAMSSEYRQLYIKSTNGLFDGLGLERIISLIIGQ